MSADGFYVCRCFLCLELFLISAGISIVCSCFFRRKFSFFNVYRCLFFMSGGILFSLQVFLCLQVFNMPVDYFYSLCVFL